MTERNITYSIGDWVVHHAYGIGQIKKIEKRTLDGKLVACFRVKTMDNAEWWFPQNNADNPRIRPMATQDTLQRVQSELQRPIKDLDPDRFIWKSQIDEVRASDDLIATSRIVRDLTLLKTKRKLNQTESSALIYFTKFLLREWSTIMNMDVTKVQLILNSYLGV